MPLSKLRKYVAAYNIKDNRAVEKDDLIDAMIAARASHLLAFSQNLMMIA
jgi:hypothetical protein